MLKIWNTESRDKRKLGYLRTPWGPRPGRQCSRCRGCWWARPGRPRQERRGWARPALRAPSARPTGPSSALCARETEQRRVFLYFFYVCTVLDSRLLHLPPLRFHCVPEDARIEPRTVASSAVAVRLSSHSATSHPMEWTKCSRVRKEKVRMVKAEKISKR